MGKNSHVFVPVHFESQITMLAAWLIKSMFSCYLFVAAYRYDIRMCAIELVKFEVELVIQACW